MRPAMVRLLLHAIVGSLVLASGSQAARPVVTSAMQPFISEDAPQIALVNARIIDGTGAPARAGQTLVIRDGVIVQLGPTESTTVADGAKVIDLAGRSVLPGLVQLHEHLWMYAGSLLSVTSSAPKLLLAAGVTSIRTAGAFNPYMELKAWTDIREGRAVGPWMDLSIYVNLFSGAALTEPAAARRYVDFWLDQGFTSVKVYAATNAAAMKAVIDLAHSRGVKVTGHLCDVTFAKAAELGIDNIEHGFSNSPDFLDPAIGEDVSSNCGMRAIRALEHVDPRGEAAKALIARLVARKVALTSTLVVYEDLMPGIPPQRGLDMLAPAMRSYHDEYRAKIGDPKSGLMSMPEYTVSKSAVMEREFMLAGGLLVSGTDPAGKSGGNLPGYASARQLELMVQHGFTPLEALRVATLNGAIYLNRQDRVGSIAIGKQADLLVVEGDPSIRISDIANAVLVFKQGIGYDPEKLRASVRGKVGLQ